MHLTCILNLSNVKLKLSDAQHCWQQPLLSHWIPQPPREAGKLRIKSSGWEEENRLAFLWAKKTQKTCSWTLTKHNKTMSPSLFNKDDQQTSFCPKWQAVSHSFPGRPNRPDADSYPRIPSQLWKSLKDIFEKHIKTFSQAGRTWEQKLATCCLHWV